MKAPDHRLPSNKAPLKMPTPPALRSSPSEAQPPIALRSPAEAAAEEEVLSAAGNPNAENPNAENPSAENPNAERNQNAENPAKKDPNAENPAADVRYFS